MEFTHETESEEVPLIQVMNSIAFSSADSLFDANFISILDPAKNSFDYYIQRLVGHEIEN